MQSTTSTIDDGPLLIMLPVFNDWDSLRLLLPRLDHALAAAELTAAVLIVDDGSTTTAPADLIAHAPLSLSTVQILPLLRNLSHQRAIALGLSYAHAHLPCRAIVVMDGDGEDAPEDVPRLIKAFEKGSGQMVVFAGRERRSEGVVFTVFYHLYRRLHRLLTGHTVEVGNFSVLPRHALHRLVVVSELWNHYAAAVYKARLPRMIIPIRRGRRLSGSTSMNFSSLVVHGLSAISVFGETVGVRLLAASGILVVVAALGLLVVLYLKFIALRAIPGWATNAAGLLVVILLQSIAVSTIFILSILNARQGSTFLPIRDAEYYWDEIQGVYPQ